MRITGRQLRQIIKEELTRGRLAEVDGQLSDDKIESAKMLAAYIMDEVSAEDMQPDLKQRRHNPIGYTLGSGREDHDRTAVMEPGLSDHFHADAAMTPEGALCVVIGTDGSRGYTVTGHRGAFEDEQKLAAALETGGVRFGLRIVKLMKTDKYGIKVMGDANVPMEIPGHYASKVYVAIVK